MTDAELVVRVCDDISLAHRESVAYRKLAPAHTYTAGHRSYWNERLALESWGRLTEPSCTAKAQMKCEWGALANLACQIERARLIRFRQICLHQHQHVVRLSSRSENLRSTFQARPRTKA